METLRKLAGGRTAVTNAEPPIANQESPVELRFEANRQHRQVMTAAYTQLTAEQMASTKADPIASGNADGAMGTDGQRHRRSA